MKRGPFSLRPWRRKAEIATEPVPAGPASAKSTTGCELLVARLDDSELGARIIEAVGERYDVTPIAEEPLLARVLVDDALYPDEAVVRLASVLDRIDGDWESRIGWPRSVAPGPPSDPLMWPGVPTLRRSA